MVVKRPFQKDHLILLTEWLLRIYTVNFNKKRIQGIKHVSLVSTALYYSLAWVNNKIRVLWCSHRMILLGRNG